MCASVLTYHSLVTDWRAFLVQNSWLCIGCYIHYVEISHNHFGRYIGCLWLFHRNARTPKYKYTHTRSHTHTLTHSLSLSLPLPFASTFSFGGWFPPCFSRAYTYGVSLSFGKCVNVYGGVFYVYGCVALKSGRANELNVREEKKPPIRIHVHGSK